MTDQFPGPYWIDPNDSGYNFPDVELALQEPDGLLALGGDLSTDRLMKAYRAGIFPWYSEGQPILWWSPNPRSVLFPANLKISRSLRKSIRKPDYKVTMDTAFEAVISHCSGPRPDDQGTWITEDMSTAYIELHRQGFAHSVEYWQGGSLLGGLYGIAIGKVFFGESMFSLARDASKIALFYLARQLENWGYPIIDCQIHSEHLAGLGANSIPREEFSRLLTRYCGPEISTDICTAKMPWKFEPDLLVHLRSVAVQNEGPENNT